MNPHRLNAQNYRTMARSPDSSRPRLMLSETMQRFRGAAPEPSDWDDLSCRRAAILKRLGWHESMTKPELWTQFCAKGLPSPIDAASEYWHDGRPQVLRLRHRMHFQDKAAARIYVAVLSERRLQFEVQELESLTETTDHHQLTLVTLTLMTEEAVLAFASMAIACAQAVGGTYDGWTALTPDSVAAGRPGQFDETRSARVFRMRTQFLPQVLAARTLLSPWVCRWADCDEMDDQLGGEGTTAANSGFGHSVMFEVTERAPKLDELRWLLNQVSELQYAAETLAYATRFDGSTMPQDVLAHLGPGVLALDRMRGQLGAPQRTSRRISEDMSAALKAVERLELVARENKRRKRAVKVASRRMRNPGDARRPS